MRRLIICSSFLLLTLLIVQASDSFAGDQRNAKREKPVVIVESCEVEGAEGSAVPLIGREYRSSSGDSEVFVFVGGEGEKKRVKVKKGAYLGVYMEELTRGKIKKLNYPFKRGVLISDVVEDGPAVSAGMEAGDIVRTFDGKKVEDPDELSEMVLEREPGDEVEIEIYRDGDKITLEAELGERSVDAISVLKLKELEDFNHKLGRIHGRLGRTGDFFIKESIGAKGKLGLVLAELNEDLAEYFDVKEDDGILVLEVLEDSPAETAGFRSGDVIVEFNGEDVPDVEVLLDELRDLDEDDEVVVNVVRKGKKHTLKAELDDDFCMDEFIFSHPSRRMRIEIPEKERFKAERFKEIVIEKETLESEMSKLKERLKELEERIAELEK